MMRGQRLDSANAVANMAAILMNVSQLDTEFNIDRTCDYLANSYNIPLSILNTSDEKQAIVQQKQEQAEAQMLAENASGISSAIKNVNAPAQ